MLNLMKIKLIIFDLDGTLVDTAPDITHALNYAIELYQIKKLTVQETIELVGEGLTRLVERLVGEDNAVVKSEVLDRFISYYSEHITDLSMPYPGVPDTLKELDDYNKAVLSNKREFLSKKLLDELNLSVYFDRILGSDSVVEKKPSPKPLYQVMDMFSVRPGETVIVGDSTYDIDAGKAAGIVTIAVSYGYRDVGLLGHADYIIDTISELRNKLDELNSRQDQGT
jgi:phosphoglycolate phosphatase